MIQTFTARSLPAVSILCVMLWACAENRATVSMTPRRAVPREPTPRAAQSATPPTPAPPPPACPAPVVEPAVSLLARYRSEMTTWLGAARAKIDAIGVSAAERETGDAARALSDDLAGWLRIQLGERLINPVAARAGHPQIRALLREVRAEPPGRWSDPIVAIGAMGGLLVLDDCDGYPRRETPWCNRARAAYWLLDFHGDELLPTLTWDGYRPPDFEATQEEAYEPEEAPPAEPAAPPAPVCPPPPPPEPKGVAFTRIFDQAVDAGLPRNAAERLAVELFTELIARAESATLADGLPPLERAYVMAAIHTLGERESARLDPARSAPSRTPTESELAKTLIALLGDRRTVEQLDDAASMADLGRCSPESYREYRRCSDPHPMLYGECEPGPRAARCVRDAYDTHALVSALDLIRRGAPSEAVAGAIEEILRQAAARGTPRAVIIDRIVRGYAGFRKQPTDGP